MKTTPFSILAIFSFVLSPLVAYPADLKIGDHAVQTVIVDGTPAHPSMPLGQYTYLRAGLNSGQGNRARWCCL